MRSAPDPAESWTLAAWGRDLHAAAAILTRLPVPPPPAAALIDPRTRRAYPLIGAFAGLAAGGVFFAAHDIGLPAAVDAVLAVAALILIGGHVDEGGRRAPAPFLAATLIKIAALYVIGAPQTPGGGPHLAVLALVAAGALSHVAAIVLEPETEADDDEAAVEPRVVILPPGGTAFAADAREEEGNGHTLGPAATALALALGLAVLTLGLMGALVAAGGAALGALVAPRALRRDIHAGTLPPPLALQQAAEVVALLALAVSLSV